jgi:hypothetical protein
MGRPIDEGQDFKPDLGNPAVRHYRGASGNVTLVEMGTHLATERAGMVTLHLTVGAPELYPNQGRIKQLEKPSSSQREISGAGPTYNRRHREEEGRREGGGWANSSDEAAQWPWSEGALLFVMTPTKKKVRVE